MGQAWVVVGGGGAGHTNAGVPEEVYGKRAVQRSFKTRGKNGKNED